jgi:hypothetical protein
MRSKKVMSEKFKSKVKKRECLSVSQHNRELIDRKVKVDSEEGSIPIIDKKIYVTNSLLELSIEHRAINQSRVKQYILELNLGE